MFMGASVTFVEEANADFHVVPDSCRYILEMYVVLIILIRH